MYHGNREHRRCARTVAHICALFADEREQALDTLRVALVLPALARQRRLANAGHRASSVNRRNMPQFVAESHCGEHVLDC